MNIANRSEINISRLWELLTRMGRIGREMDGSITRLAFSPEYNQIVDALYEEAERAGFAVCKDTLSNLIISVPGQDLEAKTIYIGSHLDTVRQGGLYDGLLGVLAGWECLRTWKDAGIKLRHTICLIGFNAEEGGELGGTFGSRAILGQVSLSDPLIQDKLKKYGLSSEDIQAAQLDIIQAQCYLELHVEQGGCLERERIPIGVVTGIPSISRLNVTCYGESNHAGSTPMDCRKDALVGMAQFILLTERLARESQCGLVATTGCIELQPNMPNVIPGQAAVTVDIRALEWTEVRNFKGELCRQAKEIPNVSFAFETAVEKEGSISAPFIQDAIRSSCLNRAVLFRELPSGAGHDANAFAKCMPTGMIFVPSMGGKSHCKEEFTSKKDIAVGTQILSDTILELDYVL